LTDTKWVEPANTTIKKIRKILDEKEKQWMDAQKEELKQNIEKYQNNSQKIEDRAIVLLKKCKSWNGPFVGFEEMENSIKNYGKSEKDLKRICRTEISLRKLHSPRDVSCRPELYKLNKLNVTQLKFNLSILVSTPYRVEEIVIPSNEQILKELCEIKKLFDV
jgi:hypothetical protein